ncbi:hypothetical protein F4604DRAFT_1920027 [Suillus subluteus]|nr:hypothetical protein F4604DRAFT_1920027 [Suillus subluteus]
MNRCCLPYHRYQEQEEYATSESQPGLAMQPLPESQYAPPAQRLSSRKRKVGLDEFKIMVVLIKSCETSILAAARERHSFLPGLHSCFQTDTCIHLGMVYVRGIDLMFWFR